MKRLLLDNTGPNGNLNNDAFQRAMLHYRNTPDRDTGLSPAMSIYGRHIRDFLPVLPYKYRPHKIWRNTLNSREEALRSRHMRAQERLSEHTRRLPPLKVGDHVRIQNQMGHYPLKWDKTGIIVEVRQYGQYLVRTDGSNRTTLRNRKFLRHFIPAQVTPPSRSIIEDIAYHQATSHQQPPAFVLNPTSPQVPIEPSIPPMNVEQPTALDPNKSKEPVQDMDPKQVEAAAPRRSSRISQPPLRLNYQKIGTPSSS